jgi:hypothetical protein
LGHQTSVQAKVTDFRFSPSHFSAANRMTRERGPGAAAIAKLPVLLRRKADRP